MSDITPDRAKQLGKALAITKPRNAYGINVIELHADTSGLRVQIRDSAGDFAVVTLSDEPQPVAIHQLSRDALAVWCKTVKAKDVLAVTVDGESVSLSRNGLVTSALAADIVDTASLPDTVAISQALTGIAVPWNELPALLLAAGKDDTLPALTGVSVRYGESGMARLASTDRYRMVITDADHLHYDGHALVPAAWLGKVTKQLGGGILGVTGEYVVVADDSDTSWLMGTRLIEAEYPKVGSLVRDSSPIGLVFDSAALRDAVKLILPSIPKNSPVVFDLAACDNVLRTLDGSVTVPMPRYDGWADGLVIGFTPAYVVDSLAGITGSVRFDLDSAGKPAIITSESTSSTRVLMPVRMATN
jgi:DNA polymerase III sliding clamp (beta) subunit (PCNA family)